MNKIERWVLAGALLAAFAATSLAWGGRVQPSGLDLIKKITVPGVAGWVDTGLDVAQGDEFYVKASGEITLQKGNPAANCGPAGLDLLTVQQPIRNQNLGALIGKVAQLISVTKDKDSDEEIRNEIVRYLFIGAEKEITAPIKGRLYLGINEDVIRDNGGEFTAVIYRRKG